LHLTTIEFLDWYKRQSGDLIDLSNSGISGPASLRDLGIRPDDLPLYGDNLYGYPPLKELLAERFAVEPARIAITPGASMGNFTVLAAIVERGDRVMVESPAYQPFVKLAEALTEQPPLMLKRRREDNYHLDPDHPSIDDTSFKVLVLSNLHNPTGVYDPPETFIQLAEQVSARNGWLLVDEVFLPFLTNGERTTSAVTHKRIIATGSLTKVWGLGGLRVGWVIAPPELSRQIERSMDYLHVVQPFITEYIAWRVLSDTGPGKRMLKSARQIAASNLEILRDFLSEFPQLDYVVPAGGISLLVRFRDGRSADEFCMRLSTEHHTLVIPGSFFGVNDGFRISFGAGEETLRRGLKSISKALNEFVKIT